MSKALFSHDIASNNIRVWLGKNKTVKILKLKGNCLCYNYNVDYVEEVYQTLLEAMNTTNCLGNAVRELKEMTPLPMNTMLDKEPRESALDLRQKRKKMVVKNVPPTTPCEYTSVRMDQEKTGM